jgi:NAD dependent epimerase/dehydratase family enzyme
MAGDVLGSARVLPARLLESGFRFTFPEIEEALRAA